MSNVKALPTRANDEQPWQCQVCKATMAYSQPINFGLCMELGKIFTDWHEEHCAPPVAPTTGEGKEAHG